MKVDEFVKEYGIEYSKMCLNASPESANYVEWYPLRSRFYISDFGCNRAVLLSDLKRLVESYELVESLGGMEKVNEYLKYASGFDLTVPRVQQAIADVESCQ